MNFFGRGILLTKCAQLVITGTSGNIDTVNFELVNKVNFPNLIFTPEIDGLMNFDEDSGVFELQDSGIFQLDATINVQASQAAAEFQLIPEFDIGAGWFSGIPRKSVLTAIKPSQEPYHGSRFFKKGTKMRFWVKAISGNINFSSEVLDTGGPLEVILPAAVFYLELHRLTSRLLG